MLGVLDPADRDSFEAHLATCDSCADEVAALLPVVALLPLTDAEALLARRPRPGSWGPTRIPVDNAMNGAMIGRSNACTRAAVRGVMTSAEWCNL